MPRKPTRRECVLSQVTEGPPMYYRPVCVLTEVGFVGGPSGYMLVGYDERDSGPLIVREDDDD